MAEWAAEQSKKIKTNANLFSAGDNFNTHKQY
jgi:hypothetical protein